MSIISHLNDWTFQNLLHLRFQKIVKNDRRAARSEKKIYIYKRNDCKDLGTLYWKKQNVTATEILVVNNHQIPVKQRFVHMNSIKTLSDVTIKLTHQCVPRLNSWKVLKFETIAWMMFLGKVWNHRGQFKATPQAQ